jgi:hypothetical protein
LVAYTGLFIYGKTRRNLLEQNEISVIHWSILFAFLDALLVILIARLSKKKQV